MFWVVDRFEEDWAVLVSDERRSRQVRRDLLPPGVKTGDALVEQGEAFMLDEAETRARGERIRSKWERLKG